MGIVRAVLALLLLWPVAALANPQTYTYTGPGAMAQLANDQTHGCGTQTYCLFGWSHVVGAGETTTSYTFSPAYPGMAVRSDSWCVIEFSGTSLATDGEIVGTYQSANATSWPTNSLTPSITGDVPVIMVGEISGTAVTWTNPGGFTQAATNSTWSTQVIFGATIAGTTAQSFTLTSSVAVSPGEPDFILLKGSSITKVQANCGHDFAPVGSTITTSLGSAPTNGNLVLVWIYNNGGPNSALRSLMTLGVGKKRHR